MYLWFTELTVTVGVLFISSSHLIESEEFKHSASCYPEWQKSVKASGMKETFHMKQLVYESVFSPVLWTLNLHVTKVLPMHHRSSRLASPQCSASNMSIHCINPQSQQQPKPACNSNKQSESHPQKPVITMKIHTFIHLQSLVLTQCRASTSYLNICCMIQMSGWVPQ